MIDLTAFLRGILAGLILTVYIGATFFLLIETSITQGARRALRMNVGVWASDILIVALLMLTGPDIFKRLTPGIWIQGFLAIVFLGMGIYFIYSSIRKKKAQGKVQKQPTTHLLFKGFFTNLLNPSVLVFWIGTIALLFNRFKYNLRHCLIFFFGLFVTIVFFDILKIYYASRLKHHVPHRYIPWLNAIAGGFIIFFSVKYIISLV